MTQVLNVLGISSVYRLNFGLAQQYKGLSAGFPIREGKKIIFVVLGNCMFFYLPLCTFF